MSEQAILNSHSPNYLPRIADRILARKLAGMGAILIKGPKWVGKTTTAEQQASSVIYIDQPDKVEANIMASQVDPMLLLDGETPRLIDEWQVAPKLWDAVRWCVDRRKADGQFILTGSSVPLDMDVQADTVHHSGTGRIAQMLMRPMSLWESRDSDGSVSLRELFAGNDGITGRSDRNIHDIAYLICRGGWPRAVMQDREIALDRAKDYLNATADVDIHRVDGVSRNGRTTRALLRSYARLQGAQAPLATICEDMKANGDPSIDDRTVFSYVEALKKLFVIEDMPAWNPNLRSKTAIRTSDTRYFVDPSLAVAALGVGPESLTKDLRTMGLLFEAMCVRDLRVYAESLGGSVSHYRDKTGLECDAVVHLADGSYGLIEIKIGGETAINEAVQSLQKLASKIDTDKMPSPSFLMVLTAVGNYAMKRNDGVLEVPICCLKD